MFEVGLVLAVYLLLLAVAFGVWLARPVAEGYFVLGGLGLVNVGLILTSVQGSFESQISLWGALAYLTY